MTARDDAVVAGNRAWPYIHPDLRSYVREQFQECRSDYDYKDFAERMNYLVAHIGDYARPRRRRRAAASFKDRGK